MSDHHFNPRADHNPDRWDWCPRHGQWEQRGNWRSCMDEIVRESEMMLAAEREETDHASA